MYLHSEVSNGQVKLYVPNDRVQREACYRSQLPNLFSSILGIASSAAAFPISLILSSDIAILDDVPQEQDISPVPWITKPAREVASPHIEQRGTSGTAGSIPSSGDGFPRTPSFVTPSSENSGTATLYDDNLSPP